MHNDGRVPSGSMRVQSHMRVAGLRKCAHRVVVGPCIKLPELMRVQVDWT